jgi:hypothetical protein
MVTDGNGAQIAMWPPQGGTIKQCANARLIAAAPELLQSVEMFRSVLNHEFWDLNDKGDDTKKLIEALEFSEKAIAKARG